VSKKKARQKSIVLAHLESNGSITPAEAWNTYGISRLSAVVWDLRHDDGVNIHTDIVHTHNRYGDACSHAVYRLVHNA
jgi:hypothetical protein